MSLTATIERAFDVVTRRLDGPLMVASDPAVPNPSILASDIGSASVVGGGASARW